MSVSKELVLYYQPSEEKQAGNLTKAARLKGVLVRMGIRIRNIGPEQVGQTVGYLAGMDGFSETAPMPKEELPKVGEEVLVLKNFTSRRIDQLLESLRRAGVPKIQLKAVVTETNSSWTFAALYEEIKKECEEMSKRDRE